MEISDGRLIRDGSRTFSLKLAKSPGLVYPARNVHQSTSEGYQYYVLQIHYTRRSEPTFLGGARVRSRGDVLKAERKHI